MAVTTVAAIRTQLITTLEALTPASIAEQKYKRAPKNWSAEQAQKNSTANLRRFWIEIVGRPEQIPPSDSTQKHLRESWRLLMVYPRLPNMAGNDGWDDLEDMIRADQDQLEDAIFSPTNYVSGCHAMIVTGTDIDKGDVWVSVIDFDIDYYAAQTIA